MTKGRKPDTVASVEWKLHIRVDIAAQVELLLKDPMRNKVKYGARSQLTEMLYQQWIDIQKRKQEPEFMYSGGTGPNALPDELPEGATFNFEPGDGNITVNKKK